METKHLKKYAPEARRDFIAAVKNKAAVYGLLPKEILPMKEEGDIVIIGDRPFPRSVAKQRKELEARIRKEGFQQFIEAIAYTWFNRFVAIRYMELHGYLDHGYRVLSHLEGKSAPEILENAERVELPGLKRDEVVDLKLDGGKDERLYQMLLMAQCNALHKAMPFLFESIKDGTELLLPDNLLHTDSLVRTLVNDIPEEQWENVEIIGWLYQFYISEKKGEVIGKVVKSEDIPAATQLFTPNWIVRYMLHNTLGRKWMATYPDSPLKQQMEYYIEPAEQTPEVQQQLKEITPDSLNPEELTLLDPACGSGHILVEAYDLFKAIYEERGYRGRDIPKLILTKNLFGLEIDDRAAQLAAFALMMKARADDRTFFVRDAEPSILAIQESVGLDAKEITDSLNAPILKEKLPLSGELFEKIAEEKSPLFSKKTLSVNDDLAESDISCLISLFEHGKTFGSLIQVPASLTGHLHHILQRVEDVAEHGGMFERTSAQAVRPLLRVALRLVSQHSIVLTNPPYLSGKYMNALLKPFISTNYSDCRTDVFAAFIRQCIALASNDGCVSFVTPFHWMYITSFSDFRSTLIKSVLPISLVQLEYNAFEPACVPVCTFAFQKTSSPGYKGRFIDLSSFKGSDSQAPATLKAVSSIECHYGFFSAWRDFERLPHHQIAFSLGPSVLAMFGAESVKDVSLSRGAVKTGNNDRFLRLFWEVSPSNVGRDKRWRLHPKGGAYRKWAGNVLWVVDWSPSARRHYQSDKVATMIPEEVWDKVGVCWTEVTSSKPSFRLLQSDEIANNKALWIFPKTDGDEFFLLGFLNSSFAERILGVLCPQLDFLVGEVQRVPISQKILDIKGQLGTISHEAFDISEDDWNSQETSPRFTVLPFASSSTPFRLLDTFRVWKELVDWRRSRLAEIETEINRLVANGMQLDDSFAKTVLPTDVVLCDSETSELARRLVSYLVGVGFGRYEGGPSGESSRSHQAVGDIMIVTEQSWFSDDAADVVCKALKNLCGDSTFKDNLKYLSMALGANNNESEVDALRRYLSTAFFNDHLTRFKAAKNPPRPIYWLFSSGKQRAFQCLVYLHHYNAGTISRMRTEYVVKLQGKIIAQIEKLEDEIPATRSTSHRKTLEKERDKLVKQREELQDFDEKLRHYADQRIELDLDDGVKVNYGKFGDLLAEVKTVTGGASE
jgi:hypothetical protein